MNKNKKLFNYYPLTAGVLAWLMGAEMSSLTKEAAARDNREEEIGLDFSIPVFDQNEPETLPTAPPAVPKPTTVRQNSAVNTFAPLEVAAPYFIDRTPPGSYDFTLLRQGNDAVEIPSPCTGAVTHVKYSSQGYGNRVEVQCEQSGYVYFMGHLKSISVRIGQRVLQGQSLGIQGSTGNSTGPHVHLEIGSRPFLEFYPGNRITNRDITSPLVYEYLRFVSAPPLLPHWGGLKGGVSSPKKQPVDIVLPPKIGLNFEVKTPDSSSETVEALSFEPTVTTVTYRQETKDVKAAKLGNNSPIDRIPEQWWELGSDSPLAIAIGASEGTRYPNGQKNPAYYWHKDPGNGKDNFGTFSYQHLSPQERAALVGNAVQKRLISALKGLPNKADKLQLQRLKGYHDQLRSQALEKGLLLRREELVNGLDLSNQSPAAGLLKGGYIDRLAQMKQLVSEPSEQIVEARIWAYWDMDKNRWDASGLGNTYASIRHDQLRRYHAVKQVLALHSLGGDVDGLRP